MPASNEPVVMFAESAATTLPLSTQERASVEAGVISSSSPRLEKVDVPSVLLENAFIPFVHPSTKALMKRPCAGDVTIMKSSAPQMGRLMVSLRSHAAGQLIFVDSPWMTIPISDTSFYPLLPPLLQQVHSRIMEHERVFDAKPAWDRRLVAPFLAYVEVLLAGRADASNRRAAMLPLLLKALANPLKDMPSDSVDSLCDYVQFLRAALPTQLDGVVPEDDACRFLAVFQTNAAFFQSSAAHMYLTDTSSHASTATSVYASGPQTRCLLGLVSLLEHSCQPNAALVWHRTNTISDNDAMVVEVRALRPIAVGERLSISYIPAVLPREERQALLWRRYWFHCQCPRCADAPDLLRGMTRPHAESDAAVLFAPVGSGSTWSVIGDATATAEAATAEHPRSALLLESEMKQRSETDPSAVVDRCIDPSASSLGLSVFHYLALRSFVAVCGRALAAGDDVFPASLDRLVRYASAVAKSTFADPPSARPLYDLLCESSSDPVASWFSQVKESATTRRVRLTAAISEGAHMQPDVATLATEVLAVRWGALGDFGHTAVSFCVAVWELLFGVAHNAVPRFPAARYRLKYLRRGAALGLWLMQVFALQQHESTRAMQWQAALLEATEE
jgi:hypothetical protein